MKGPAMTGLPAQPPFLTGERVVLRALTRDDASAEYLAWLNDPAVLRYRGNKSYPSRMDDLLAYIESIPARGDLVLAVCTAKDGRHIGNISLISIQWVHVSAELSIMLGARDIWGGGYGSEAMALITCHGFEAMGLHRLWAESPNPAFNAVVERQGWTREGVKREAFALDGKRIDFTCWSLLAPEYFAARAEAGAGR